MSDREIFRIKEAAEFLTVSESWLERSDIPRSKLGGNVVFLKAELLAYVEAHLTHSVRRPRK